jgi:hypothetical protein
MSYYNLCGIGSQHSNISKGKGGTYKNHWYARFLPETSACDINKAKYFI